MGRHSRPRPARGLTALLAVVAVVAAGCPGELGYVSAGERIPFTVTLTADRPVAIRDIAVTIDRRPIASYAPSCHVVALPREHRSPPARGAPRR